MGRYTKTGYELPVINHTASVRQKNKLVAGKWTYKSAEKYDCYMVESVQRIIGENSISVVSTVAYYLDINIDTGDMIDDKVVIAVRKPRTDSLAYYIAYIS